VPNTLGKRRVLQEEEVLSLGEKRAKVVENTFEVGLSEQPCGDQ
jgi:hypothetical protein